jgi:hypothetical protein
LKIKTADPCFYWRRTNAKAMQSSIFIPGERHTGQRNRPTTTLLRPCIAYGGTKTKGVGVERLTGKRARIDTTSTHGCAYLFGIGQAEITARNNRDDHATGERSAPRPAGPIPDRVFDRLRSVRH